MKGVLYGTAESEPQTELVAQLAQETYNSGLIPLLVLNLAKFDFEVRQFFSSCVFFCPVLELSFFYCVSVEKRCRFNFQ